MNELVGHFLNFMTVDKGASGNTVAAYKNDLGQLERFITGLPDQETPVQWDKVGSDLIIAFVLSMKSRGNAEATVSRKLAAIKSFFQYMQAKGDIRDNPTENIESPTVGRQLPKPLSVEDVDELLEQPLKHSTPEAQRDRAMLEVLYATGMRVTELVSINVRDIDLSAKQEHVVCTGNGGRNDRSLPIHDRAVDAVKIYLDSARAALVKNQKEAALFLNRRGERLTRQGFWLILKQYAKEANITQSVSPHTLRHSFATHMISGGATVQELQILLGHATISTTQVYTAVTNAHASQVYTGTHPRAKVPAT